uniref:sperm-associated antigen 1 isoform X1 n=1 Tax=Macaca mulatta TaxID=9544 RepID=UPI0010A233E7|nr:sperm-associated antigen 1 isoform X1 [Macaca mulatta]XP_015001270.2 sperm-associated antigen 1 isoform X1 [Macaca mulatta]XP_015001271.2 sperm-associated antigen 1 isoform X1 [Macaca mulatta]XP_015001272.2 sperm-associated antigen 1 isoform X1 [Macaca mulatta]
MTTKDYPSLWGFGTTKTFKIPIEHLDFKYIEKCSDVKHLEKILCVLRSGEEGYYPELTGFCEKHLEALAPESRALRKDKPAATAASFTAEEWEKIDDDIKSWVSEIKKEEDKMHFHETETFPAMKDNLPPVRGSNSCLHVGKEKCSKRPTKKKTPRDYAEWDKFDVEKECLKIDEDYKEKTVIDKSHFSKIETRIDTAGLTEKEKDFLAIREKEKGNEAFNSGDYEEAVMYYTRSISALPTVVAYNNRAQAEIKLQNWNSAFQDCEKVLELEPGNIKALLRRATTYKHQNKLQEAIEDLSKVLDVEPDNELAKKTLSEVERDLKNSEAVSKTQTKGKRMVIQEIENSEDEEGKDSGRKHEDGSGDKKPAEPAGAARAAQPCAMGNIQKKLTGKAEGGKRPARGAPRRGQTPEAGADKRSPRRASAAAAAGGGATGHPGGGPGAETPAAPLSPAGLKSQGNELFRSGQFAEAASKYSAAIALLEPAGSEIADDLSILYSNRAACYLKEGNCSGCIQDCNRALELHPFSMKPLLRRAMAYETLEQYGKAYVDYKTVLQIDCGLQLANDSVNRLSRILMELEGPNWREKLSPIPAVPASVPLQAWHPATEMISKQAGDSSSHHQQDITDEKTFKALKEEGNQCVNDKNYKDALRKYSECLKINNKECAIYTNRALCYLKLCQFEEAKQDCDQALQLDDGNVKACYRRALAHKGLKNYQKSLIDLNKVLLLDSSIIEAKMELEEVTRLLNLKDKTASFNKEKERRKIEIQEVNEGNEEEPGRPAGEVSTGCLASEKGDKSSGSPEDPEKLPIAKPNNAYEFGQIINALSTRKDKEACAHLLAITAPKDLPMLLSNKLEGDTFLLLIQSLKNNLIEKDPSLVYQHLLYLSKAERFKMMLTLISKGQEELIEQLFKDLSDTPNNHFTLEDIQALKRQYEL